MSVVPKYLEYSSQINPTIREQWKQKIYTVFSGCQGDISLKCFIWKLQSITLTLWFIINLYLVFIPFLIIELLKFLEFPMLRSRKMSFVILIRWLCGGALEWVRGELVARGVSQWLDDWNFREVRGAGDWVQLPVVSDWTKLACVMKAP